MNPLSPRLPKSRVLLWFLIMLLVVWDVVRLAAPEGPVRHAGVDFLGYWASTRLFLHGGNPYDAAAVLAAEQAAGYRDPKPLVMWSPPWTHILLLPFVLFSYSMARGLWFCLNMLLLLWTATSYWKTAGGPSPPWPAWAAVFLFVPSALALNIGQTSPLVLFGLIGFIRAVEKRRDLLAGFFACLLTVKPHVVYLFWVFLIIWTVRYQRWRVPAGLAGTLAACAGLAWLYNRGIYVAYLQGLFSDTGAKAWETPTLATVLRVLLPQHEGWVLYVPAAAGLIVAVWLWFRWRGEYQWRPALIPITLLSTITAPYGWTMDLVVLLPVALILIVRFRLRPARQWPWFACLVATQLATAMLLYTARSYFALFWLAPAVALIYLFSNRTERHSGPNGLRRPDAALISASTGG